MYLHSVEYCSVKGLTHWQTHATMGMNFLNVRRSKKAQHKRVDTICFYLYEAKNRDHDGSKNTIYCFEEIRGACINCHEIIFRGDENILYLDLGGGYMGLYLVKNMELCVQDVCILLCANYTSEKSLEKYKRKPKLCFLASGTPHFPDFFRPHFRHSFWAPFIASSSLIAPVDVCMREILLFYWKVCFL